MTLRYRHLVLASAMVSVSTVAEVKENPFFQETFGGKYYVVKVYYDELHQLERSEQLSAYYLQQAGVVSRDLTFYMMHPEALFVKETLEELLMALRSNEELQAQHANTLKALETYLKVFYTWHGPYEWPGTTKHLWNTTLAKESEFFAALKAALHSSPSGEGNLRRALSDGGKKTTKEASDVLAGMLFDPSYDPFVFNAEGDLGRHPLYGPDLTGDEIKAFREKKYPDEMYPSNTILEKDPDGKIQEIFLRAGGRDLPMPPPMPEREKYDDLQSEITRLKNEKGYEEEVQELTRARNELYFAWIEDVLGAVVRGDKGYFVQADVPPGPSPYRENLTAVVRELRKASKVTNCRKYPNKCAGIELQARFFETGEAVYGWASWLAFNLSKAPVLSLIGFGDGYLDPFRAGGGWKTSFFMKNESPWIAKATAPDLILGIQSRFPWDRRHDNPQVSTNAVLIDIFLNFGALCPACWSGFNNTSKHFPWAPSMSTVVLNWANARMLGAPPAVFDEFYRPDDTLTRINRMRAAELRQVFVVGHEGFGHGMGRRDPSAGRILGAMESPLEEARADAAALYAMLDEDFQPASGLSDEDVAAWYLNYATDTLLNFNRIPDGETEFKRPHERARNLIVNFLREGGHGLNAVNEAGEPWKKGEKVYYKVTDAVEMRRGVGILLSQLMDALGIPTNRDLAEMLDRKYAAPIPEGWLEQCKARGRDVGYTPQWVGNFPILTLRANLLEAALARPRLEIVEIGDFLTHELFLSGKVDIAGRATKRNGGRPHYLKY